MRSSTFRAEGADVLGRAARAPGAPRAASAAAGAAAVVRGGAVSEGHVGACPARPRNRARPASTAFAPTSTCQEPSWSSDHRPRARADLPDRPHGRPSPPWTRSQSLRTEPQALPSTARARRPGESLPADRSTSGAGRAGGASPHKDAPPSPRARLRGGAPLLIILAQAKLDGTRWQVVPAYLGAVTCAGLNALGRVKGVRLPKILCRCVAAVGAAGASVSTLAGVFAPVFPMPKPTGPYRVGKTTRLWVDRNRRSWLLKTKRVFGAQALPEHRMMMADIWYPARAEDSKKRTRRIRSRRGRRTRRPRLGSPSARRRRATSPRSGIRERARSLRTSVAPS